MAKNTENGNPRDDLDAFFNATENGDPLDINTAITNLLQNPLDDEEDGDRSSAPARSRPPAEGGSSPADVAPKAFPEFADAADAAARENLDGRFIALDPAALGKETEAPFVLIPAHIHSYVPRWGWAAIGISLAMLVAGVVFMPVWSLNRLASRLADPNEANVQYAMRSLVMNGDERTVRKLFDIASSSGENLLTRLRAVDTMSLIGGVPEVDRSLLRLELAGGTHERVREAAIAARRQREAARTRRGGEGGGE